MTDQEKREALKDIIAAMLAMEDPEKQFMLGYIAGASARVDKEQPRSA